MPGSFPLALLSALVFYGVLPLLGAFLVRSRWRQFRAQLYQIRQAKVFSGLLDENGGETLVFGTVEGIQGSDKLWIRSVGRSIQVEMKNVLIYELGGDDLLVDGHQLPSPPTSLRWQQLGPLPESSPVMVWGKLLLRNGLLVVEPATGARVNLVLYEGDPETVLKRLIWSGRQRNEYWNAFTPVSFIIGFAILAIFIFTATRESTNRLWAIILTTVAVMPFSVLLPPGIAGFFAYRSLWRRGRICRARRDLCSFNEKTGARAELLQKKARRLEWAALILFFLALLANSSLVFLLLAQLAAVR